MGVIVIVKVRCYFSLLETDRYVNSKSERSHNYCRCFCSHRLQDQLDPQKVYTAPPFPSNPTPHTLTLFCRTRIVMTDSLTAFACLRA